MPLGPMGLYASSRCYFAEKGVRTLTWCLRGVSGCIPAGNSSKRVFIVVWLAGELRGQPVDRDHTHGPCRRSTIRSSWFVFNLLSV